MGAKNNADENEILGGVPSGNENIHHVEFTRLPQPYETCAVAMFWDP